MYYLTDFKHFVSIFSSFSIQWPPFPLIFNFLTPYFYKSLDPIGSIFFRVLYPGTDNLMKYLPPWGAPCSFLSLHCLFVPHDIHYITYSIYIQYCFCTVCHIKFYINIYFCPMKEKLFLSLKKFATARSFIATFVNLAFQGLIIKTALVKILFKCGSWHLPPISLVLSIYYFMAGLPSKLDSILLKFLNKLLILKH